MSVDDRPDQKRGRRLTYHRHVSVGEIIGEGRTSTVYAWGTDAVVKVPKPHIPDGWLAVERTFVDAVGAVGAPAPDVGGTVTVEGRESVVFERIEGDSMWDVLQHEPARQHELMEQFGALQREIHALSLPSGVPDAVARMRSKLGEIVGLRAEEHDEASDVLDSLPRGAAVLHGDLHPGNVIVTDAGLVAIDWFDVSIGHPHADVLRTELLLRPLPDGPPLHLPGATHVLLGELHEAYRQVFADVVDGNAERWRPVVALCRLSEAAELDAQDLWHAWRTRPSRTESVA